MAPRDWQGEYMALLTALVTAEMLDDAELDSGEVITNAIANCPDADVQAVKEMLDTD